jgi:hypothetical protein
MKVGDIVKFKNGRSHYERYGYSYLVQYAPLAHEGGFPDRRQWTVPINDNVDGDRLCLAKPFPKKMRGKLAIITKMHEGHGETATEVCMINHDPYGDGDKIVPLPNAVPGHPNLGTDNIGTFGFIEGLDLKVVSHAHPARVRALEQGFYHGDISLPQGYLK